MFEMTQRDDKVETGRLAFVLLMTGLLLQLSPVSVAGEPSPSEQLKTLEKQLEDAPSKEVFEDLSKLYSHRDLLIRRGAAYLLCQAALNGREGVTVTVKKATGLLKTFSQGKTDDIWKTRSKILLDLTESRDSEEKLQANLLKYDRQLKQASGDEKTIFQAEALGDLHLLAGNKSDAKKAWDFALKLAKSHAEYFDSELVWVDVRRIKNKIKKLSAKPKKTDLEQLQDMFKKANQLRRSGKCPEARKLYEQIKSDPSGHELVDASTYYIGLCYSLEGEHQKALDVLLPFTKSNPGGPWRGHAYILAGDIYLEFAFDADKAKEQFEACHVLLVDARSQSSWEGIAYKVYQRLGVIAYVEGGTEATIEWFDKAAKNNPPRFYRDPNGVVPSGVQIMADKLRNGEDLVPAEAKRGNKTACLMTILGEINFLSEDFEKAIPIFDRVIARDLARPTSNQVAWAHYRNGTMHLMKFRFDPAVEHFKTLINKHSKSPWCDDGLMRLAGIYWNNLKEPEKAQACYRLIAKRYSRGNEVERAAYYNGVIYEWTEQYEKALKEYAKFLKKYPDSPYAKAVREKHIAVIEDLLSQQETK